jgi:hypothetical protein
MKQKTLNEKIIKSESCLPINYCIIQLSKKNYYLIRDFKIHDKKNLSRLRLETCLLII